MGSNTMNGTIDDFRIYNRALSPKEVRDLYNFAPGPVGYWKLDEHSGSTANDSSGNGNTGTITGASWTNGKFGASLNFDGSGDYSTIANENNFDFERTTPFSVGMWINSTDTDTNNVFLSKYNGTNGYEMYISGENLYFQIGNTFFSNWMRVHSTQDVVDGNWHYIAVSYTGTSTAAGVSIYIDGVKVTTTTDYDTLSATALNDSSLRI